MIETIKHLFGLCGETHLNIYTVLLLAVIIKIGYERYTSKNIWSSRRRNS